MTTEYEAYGLPLWPLEFTVTDYYIKDGRVVYYTETRHEDVAAATLADAQHTIRVLYGLEGLRPTAIVIRPDDWPTLDWRDGVPTED